MGHNDYDNGQYNLDKALEFAQNSETYLYEAECDFEDFEEVAHAIQEELDQLRKIYRGIDKLITEHEANHPDFEFFEESLKEAKENLADAFDNLKDAKREIVYSVPDELSKLIEMTENVQHEIEEISSKVI